MSAECRLPAPRQPLDNTLVGDVEPATPLPEETVADSGDRERAHARLQAARILIEIDALWTDQWAETPIDLLPDFERGTAQLPLLAVASVLACLIGTMPSALL